MSPTMLTRRFFSTTDVVRHAKEMQLRHWRNHLSGGFTDEYEQSVRKIGHTHYRLGLEPRLYIGGYNFTVTGLCEAIAARKPLGRFDRNAAKKRAALHIRAAILDMDLSQSVYLEAMEQCAPARLAESRGRPPAVDRRDGGLGNDDGGGSAAKRASDERDGQDDGCAGPGGRRRRRADGGQCERGFSRHDPVELFGQ